MDPETFVEHNPYITIKKVKGATGSKYTEEEKRKDTKYQILNVIIITMNIINYTTDFTNRNWQTRKKS